MDYYLYKMIILLELAFFPLFSEGNAEFVWVHDYKNLMTLQSSLKFQSLLKLSSVYETARPCF